MNIFYLSTDPVLAAQYQCNKHVVKMILETAQLLSSAHHVLDSQNDLLYKLTHKNHPCAIWTRSNKSNYYWLYSHFQALLEEYTFRYNKVHSSSKLLKLLSNAPKNIPDGEFYDPPKCMQDEYKLESCIDSYRNYYMKAKKNFAKWTKRKIPDWYNP